MAKHQSTVARLRDYELPLLVVAAYILVVFFVGQLSPEQKVPDDCWNVPSTARSFGVVGYDIPGVPHRVPWANAQPSYDEKAYYCPPSKLRLSERLYWPRQLGGGDRTLR